MKTKADITTKMEPKPNAIVSMRDENGRNNALVVAFASNASLDPPMLMVGIVESRFSYDIVKQRGEFVVNIPAKGFEQEYEYLGTVSGRDEDKFETINLKYEDGDVVDAPILTDCPVNFECTVIDSIKPGTHELFIGKVEAVHADDEYVDEEGKVDWSKIDLL